jgi:hypothetical protein
VRNVRKNSVNKPQVDNPAPVALQFRGKPDTAGNPNGFRAAPLIGFASSPRSGPSAWNQYPPVRLPWSDCTFDVSRARRPHEVLQRAPAPIPGRCSAMHDSHFAGRMFRRPQRRQGRCRPGWTSRPTGRARQDRTRWPCGKGRQGRVSGASRSGQRRLCQVDRQQCVRVGRLHVRMRYR